MLIRCNLTYVEMLEQWLLVEQSVQAVSQCVISKFELDQFGKLELLAGTGIDIVEDCPYLAMWYSYTGG